MTACTGFAAKFHNDGWDNVNGVDKAPDGWCPTTTRTSYIASITIKNNQVSRPRNGQLITVIKITSPDAGKHRDAKLTVRIPFCRYEWSDRTGYIFFKIFESDPTGYDPCNSGQPLWFTQDSAGVHKAYWDVGYSTGANSITFNPVAVPAGNKKTYYLAIRASTMLSIGEMRSCTYSFDYTYTTYTNVTANKPTINDNKNNNFTIVASGGNNGTNNKVKSTTLQYRIGSSDSWHDHSSHTKAGSLTCGASDATQTIYARTIAKGEMGDTSTSSEASLSIKNYRAPSTPGKPALTGASFKNGRLTVKQNWTYSWTAATQTNTSSPVKGYWIQIWRLPKGGSWTSVKTQTLGVTTSYTFNPNDYGFAAGDQVQFEICAYTTNGLGTWLNSTMSGGYYTLSSKTPVENAGVVNVKVGGAWKEGQVFVKVAGAWKEAETVNVKVGGTWKESQ